MSEEVAFDFLNARGENRIVRIPPHYDAHKAEVPIHTGLLERLSAGLIDVEAVTPRGMDKHARQQS